MKSFFQSYSFLRNKEDFQSVAHAPTFGWLFGRFFVASLVLSFVILGIYSLIYIPSMVSDYTGPELSKSSVLSGIDALGSSIMRDIPVGFTATLSGDTLSTNATGSLVIGSGLFDAQEKPLIQIDTLSDTPDATKAYITFAKYSVISDENNDGKTKQEYYNQKGDVESVTVSDQEIKEMIPLVSSRINMHRTSMIIWMIVLGCIGLLLSWILGSALVAVFAVLLSYIYALVIRAGASIAGNGRDYTQSYNNTVLASFVPFILSYIYDMPWYIDVVLIGVVLVYVYKGNEKSEIS